MTDVAHLPPPTEEAWKWQFEGNCRRIGPEVFFHPEGERGRQRRLRADRAKAVCMSCPVIQECRDHALALREPYGVWGGMTEEERSRFLDERELAS